MKYSNYAKIIDPNSEYYGQVFEVDITNHKQKCVILVMENADFNETKYFFFDQIQFCVTKDNEPVKIGEEYLSIGDKICDREIYNFAECYGDVTIFWKDDEFKKGSHSQLKDCLGEVFTFLHPTNKIKITAEKIESLEEFEAQEIQPNTYETKELVLRDVVKKINELIRAFNKISK